MILLLFLFLLAASREANGEGEEMLDEMRVCVAEEGWGNASLVCDPHHRLANSTRDKLHNLLAGLHSKISCTCPDGCKRADGSSGYVGLIHVTNSFSSQNLSDDMRRMFRERGLGNATCSHGLLLVYLKDTQKLASYRGENTFVLLTDEDMIKLHQLAKKGGDAEGDTLALQYLLHNYKDVVESPVQRAESWTPVVGLIAAILLVLLALALLLALFLARFCCCCAKRKKEVYHVTPTPTYKTIEPIYVVTPPVSDRYPLAPHSEALYSTPYSGSPMPLGFPPPPGSAGTHRLRPPGSSLSGGPETPASKRRAQRMRSPIPSGYSNPMGPRRGAGPESPESDYAAVAADYASMQRDRMHAEVYGSLPRHPLHSPASARSDASSSAFPPPSLITQSDLPFLDPRRKQETQTREELIY